ncbi:MAG: hypothetical protein AAGG02_15550 [Cyanobacteria bacterium P01_H01_bin.15]
MVKKRRRSTGKYSENKSKVGISLTPTGVNLLGQLAKEAGLSKSELVERLARGSISLNSESANQVLTLSSLSSDGEDADSPLTAAKIAISAVQQAVNDSSESNGKTAVAVATPPARSEEAQRLEQLQRQLSDERDLAAQQATTNDGLKIENEGLKTQLSEVQARLEALAAQQVEAAQADQKQAEMLSELRQNALLLRSQASQQQEAHQQQLLLKEGQIQQLQSELEQSTVNLRLQADERNKAHQQQLALKEAQIQQLQSELEQSTLTLRSQSVERLEAQQKALEQKEQELVTLQAQNRQLRSDVEDSFKLQQTIEVQLAELKDLRAKVHRLESTPVISKTEIVTRDARIVALQRELERFRTLEQELQQSRSELRHLRTLASFGERQLNKWRRH